MQRNRLWHREWSVKTYLAVLGLACALPVALLAGFFAYHVVSDAATARRADLDARLNLLRDGVDRRIGSAIRVLQVLADAPSLRQGRMEDFRIYASDTAKALGALVIVLADPEGRQLVNTREPVGITAPPRRDLTTQDKVLATGRPQVSDLYHATIDGRPVITVEVPVPIDGEIKYVLAMGLEPKYLSALMNDYVPAGVVGSIVDRKGVIIARQPEGDPAGFVGQLAIPEVRAHLGNRAASWINATSRAGEPIFLSIVHSDLTNWNIVMGLPRGAVDGALQRTALFLFGLALFAFLASLVLASALARRFLAALHSLQLNVTQLGMTRKFDPQQGPIREINAMEDVLHRIMRRQEMLIDEINHRVRNTLATVQSIARASLTSSATLKDYSKSFNDRLIALAKAYDLLTESHWEGVDLSTIIQRTLAPYASGERIKMDGPSVILTPKMAISLSAAIQELSTNAAKYGALSCEGGSVEVTWRHQQDGKLFLRWIERGGPPPQPPTRVGFGTRLIRDLLAQETGWQVSLDYAPQGLQCTMTIDVGQNPRLPHGLDDSSKTI